MKKLFNVLILAVFVWNLAGCGTMAGLGQDVQTAGEKLEGAATKKK